MSALTAAQITTIRQIYIRDEWTGNAGLSRFNLAYQKNFFSSEQIKAIDDRLQNEWDEELDELQAKKKNERLDAGDSDATATIEAATARFTAQAKLIQADCLEIMMNDPGFRSSMVVPGSSSKTDLFAGWKEEIAAARAYMRSRSGSLGTVRLERL